MQVEEIFIWGKKRKKNHWISLLDDYYYQTPSNVANQNAGFALVHSLGDTNSRQSLDTVFFKQKSQSHSPCFRTVHYGKHSLRYFEPHLWNKLDKNDREKPNVKSFINSIKSKDLSHLIDNCKNCDICCQAVLNFTFYIYSQEIF